MTGWLSPGSLTWLVAHELRVAYRRNSAGWFGRMIGAALLLAYVAAGVAAGQTLRPMPVQPEASWYAPALVGVLTVLTFMVVQALIATQRTIYHVGDLELLCTSPLPVERILAAKLTGVAVTIVGTFGILIFPLALPVAYLAEPRLFGAVPVILSLAMVATSAGLALTLILVRMFGARGARVAGSLLAAALGAGVFLATQFSSQTGSWSGQEIDSWVATASDAGWGQVGLGSLPVRALFGEIEAILTLLGAAAAVLAATNLSFRVYFVEALQAASEKRSRQRSRDGALRGFGGGLVRRMVAKEAKLLSREPEVLFQLMLRILYLTPLIFVATRRGEAFGDPRALAATGALIAGQLAGSLAWLAASAEESPDLLTVAPLSSWAITRAKLGAVLLMTAPFALVMPVLLAAETPIASSVALLGALVSALVAALIEIGFAVPQARSSFNRRRGASLVARILGLFAALGIAGLTGLAVHVL